MTTITLNGNPISYHETGAGDGPAVVLLPGWNEDHRMYKHVAPILARRHRVLALDWRGHGEDRAHDGDFTIDEMAGDIVAFVDALGLDQVYTVSSSHGGWAAVEAAQRLGADRAAKIALVSWKLDDPGEALLTWCDDWQREDAWEEARAGFFAYALGDSGNADVAHHVRDEMSSFGAGYWNRTGREIGASYRKWPTVADRLAALGEPRPVTHIYTLPHEAGYVRANLEFAAAHDWFVPHRLPGETHFPVLESPAAVSRILHEFFTGVDLSGAR
ncbi:alpha/beta fold hydrolase [Actinomadura rugatobispora]|uniref:Alpha/beta fold hydrolase n=1 Tax=Actinomadura rugatobispora TaxID=1994 RepID=A0ABW1A0F4_9ACTN|nr:alpha/beta hydrolase [Actinomadura rugatobispora]